MNKPEKHPDQEPRLAAPLSMPALIYRSCMVLLTNLIPLYGVWRLGWSSFILILLFIIEGAIVFLMDLVKRPWVKVKEKKKILFFEFVFITFFGFFAILIFGRDEAAMDLIETTRSAFGSARALPLWPVLGILSGRLLRTGEELLQAGLFRSGKGQTLYFSGGGWMLLLFFLVMTAPFIADKSPNPMAGLIAVIVLKTLGEFFGVWAARIVKV
ncbi:MAG TPA: DUF6498-containing protein [bacterium]|nr:DUF6498-containing protein [bacterium]HQG44268.1 DUF6498-containing protein [bacterium]HQI50338.1 DUF6498-containing protein [bacterium]HQJ63506.1 DUF6498-containing protein [bacterium]